MSPAKKRTSVAAVEMPIRTASAVDALASDTTLVRNVSVDLIDPHPRNPRRDLGDLDELTASIRSHGIQQPVTLVPHTGDAARFFALMGHRRIEAARLAGLTSVPAIINTNLSEAAQLEVMLVENLQRQDLTPFEEGAGFQGLLDLGVDKNDLAGHTGRARSTIDQRLRIAPLAAGVQAAYKARSITLLQAVELADIRDADTTVYDGLISTLDREGILSPWRIEQAHKNILGNQKLADALADAKAKGIVVLAKVDRYPRKKHAEVKELGLKAKAHEACPSHALHFELNEYSGTLSRTVVCADAPKHHPDEWKALTSNYGGGGRSSEEQQAEQASTADLRDAADARSRWLEQVFTIDSDENLTTRAAALAVVMDLLTTGIGLAGKLPIDGEQQLITPKTAVDTITYAIVAQLLDEIPTNNWYARNISTNLQYGSSGARIAMASWGLMASFGYVLSRGEVQTVGEVIAAFDVRAAEGHSVPGVAPVLRDLVAADAQAPVGGVES